MGTNPLIFSMFRKCIRCNSATIKYILFLSNRIAISELQIKILGEFTMKKVLWFSRHQMAEEQRQAQGADVEILQVSKSVQSARELAKEISEVDILAVVAPIGLQAEFLKLAEGKPVISAVSERILVPQDGGEDKVVFQFVKWERLLKIEVVKEDFKGV